MTLLSDLSRTDLVSRLAGTGLHLKTGPFTYHIKTGIALIADGIHALYGDYPLLESPGFSDFHIEFGASSLLRRYLRSNVQFFFDGHPPFNAVPSNQAVAFFEWCLNWCVSVHPNHYLKLHAAVISKGDMALIMPGAPGSGKSTLTAALVLRGWRLLSDEHALIELSGDALVPLCRPISLKNKSIEVIKDFDSSAVFGPYSEDTHKGLVAHMRVNPGVADASGVQSITRPKWLVFPRYSPGASVSLTPCARSEAFMRSAEQSFNYRLLGERGFDAMSGLMNRCDCYDLVYSDLNQAVACINELVVA